MLERYEKRYHNLLDPWDNDEQFQNISKCYSKISKHNTIISKHLRTRLLQLETSDDLRIYIKKWFLNYDFIPELHKMIENKDTNIFETAYIIDDLNPPRICKIALRFENVVSDISICMSIHYDYILKKFNVDTVWLNKTSDVHYTLNSENYCSHKLEFSCKNCSLVEKNRKCFKRLHN